MMSNKGAVMSRLVSPFVDFFLVRGCLHDTGTSFILVPVNPGSYLSLCICLHDTGKKYHTSTTRAGMRFYM